MEILVVLYVAVSVWMFIKDNYKDAQMKALTRFVEENFSKEVSDYFSAFNKETDDLSTPTLLSVGRVVGALTWPIALPITLLLWGALKLYVMTH